MDYKLKVVGGRLDFADMSGATAEDQRNHFMAQMKAAMRIKDHSQRRNAVEAMVLPPIRKVADYLEWSQMFFVTRPVSPAEDVKIAKDEYTAVAVMNSPDGEPFYVRPWRQYSGVTYREIKAGMELEWDTGEWGWDVAGTKMLEVSEELARKRDDFRVPLLDAAAVANGGHIPTVATSITRDSVNSIIKTSTRVGFPVTQVACNSARLMDQTEWTLASNSMVSGSMPESLGQDLVTKLFTNGYGNLSWALNHTIPYSYLYFSGPASKVGHFFTKGTLRSASDTDIDRGVDRYNWRQVIGAEVQGTWWVWRLQVT